MEMNKITEVEFRPRLTPRRKSQALQQGRPVICLHNP